MKKNNTIEQMQYIENKLRWLKTLMIIMGNVR